MAESTHIAARPELEALSIDRQERKNALRWKILLSNLTGHVLAIGAGMLANIGFDRLSNHEGFREKINGIGANWSEKAQQRLFTLARATFSPDDRQDFRAADAQGKRAMSILGIARTVLNATVSMGGGYGIKRFMDHRLNIGLPVAKAARAQLIDTLVQLTSWVGLGYASAQNSSDETKMAWSGKAKSGLASFYRKLGLQRDAKNFAYATYQQYTPDTLGLVAHTGMMLREVDSIVDRQIEDERRQKASFREQVTNRSAEEAITQIGR